MRRSYEISCVAASICHYLDNKRAVSCLSTEAVNSKRNNSCACPVLLNQNANIGLVSGECCFYFVRIVNVLRLGCFRSLDHFGLFIFCINKNKVTCIYEDLQVYLFLINYNINVCIALC